MSGIPFIVFRWKAGLRSDVLSSASWRKQKKPTRLNTLIGVEPHRLTPQPAPRANRVAVYLVVRRLEFNHHAGAICCRINAYARMITQNMQRANRGHFIRAMCIQNNGVESAENRANLTLDEPPLIVKANCAWPRRLLSVFSRSARPSA